MLHLVRCSVNYMVTSVLYDQFRALNKDFRIAIGCRGEIKEASEIFVDVAVSSPCYPPVSQFASHTSAAEASFKEASENFVDVTKS